MENEQIEDCGCGDSVDKEIYSLNDLSIVPTTVLKELLHQFDKLAEIATNSKGNYTLETFAKEFGEDISKGKKKYCCISVCDIAGCNECCSNLLSWTKAGAKADCFGFRRGHSLHDGPCRGHESGANCVHGNAYEEIMQKAAESLKAAVKSQKIK